MYLKHVIIEKIGKSRFSACKYYFYINNVSIYGFLEKKLSGLRF